MFFAILVSTLTLYVRCLPIQTPRNIIEDSRSTVNSFPLRLGCHEKYYIFFDNFLKKEYLTSLTFNDNLLALDKLVILISSWFIFSSKTFMSLCEKKTFAFSMNVIVFSNFEAWCGSSTYNRHKNSPKIDPSGTLHVTVALLINYNQKK